MQRGLLVSTAALTGLLLAGGLLFADDEKDARESDPAATFGQLDTNKDGQIAGDEVPEARKRLFERLVRIADKDHNSTLSQEEFVAGLKEAAERRAEGNRGGRDHDGPNPERMFGRMDKNGDGKITLDEVPEEGRERFSHLMDRADKDADKALTKEELSAAFQAFATRMRDRGPTAEGDEHHGSDFRPFSRRGFPSAERMGDWLMRLDADKDGKISEAEFLEPTKKRFANLDANKDGFVDAAEVKQRLESAAERFRQGLNSAGDPSDRKPAEPAAGSEPAKP